MGTIGGGRYTATLTDPEKICRWDQMRAHAGEQFTTSGRGRRSGVPFTYEIKGGEMFVYSKAYS